MTTPELVSAKGFYTNFARFRQERVEPIVERLVTDEEMRRAVTPLDDATLALALAEIDRMARTEGVRYEGWWGYGEPVNQFICAQLPEPD